MSRSRVIFSLALGLIDGLLTALILAAVPLIRGGHHLSLVQSLKLAAVGGLSGSFTLFVSEYARLRIDLSRSARELNLISPSPLLSSRLGTQILRQALCGAAIGSACSFVGALLPLVPGALCPQIYGLPVLIAELALALLGWMLGSIVGGWRASWAGALVIVGAVITAIGVWLNVVS